MANVELAEELKKAGLAWNPREGDFTLNLITNKKGVVKCVRRNGDLCVFELSFLDGGYQLCTADECLWLPRLDQILNEIGNLVSEECWLEFKKGTYRFYRRETEKYGIRSNTPDMATGVALLLYLKKKNTSS